MKYMKGELEEIFQACVNEIKKHSIKCSNKNSEEEPVFDKKLKSIMKSEEKMRILDLFISNETVLNKLYNMIFSEKNQLGCKLFQYNQLNKTVNDKLSKYSSFMNTNYSSSLNSSYTISQKPKRMINKPHSKVHSFHWLSDKDKLSATKYHEINNWYK